MAKLQKQFTTAKPPASGGVQYYIPEDPRVGSLVSPNVTIFPTNTQNVTQNVTQTVSPNTSSTGVRQSTQNTVTDVTPKESFIELDKIKSDLEKLQNAFYKNNFSTSQDFPKYSRFNSRIKVPTYATAPTTCEIGELYVNSGTGKLYVCSSANTWGLVGTQA